jgi:tetratricopeptide (TPR) repeat protein
LEIGWLLGVTITPVFFNVYSSRVFEPDKLTSLRVLAVVMAALWLVRYLEEKLKGREPLRFSWRTPLVLPALLTMLIYLVSSAFSLVPYTSIMGSYQRLQGTHTLFGYLVLFFALLTTLRTREQLARLFTVLILNSLPVALYGIIQRNGLDPLPWAGDVTRRVASNMGNAIFVSAYLIMIVPLTAVRIIQSFNDILNREEARFSDIFRASSYIFILAVQLLTIYYSQSRGPWLGILAAGFLLPFLALIQLLKQEQAADPGASGTVRDVVSGTVFGIAVLAVTAGLAIGLLLLTRLVGLDEVTVLQTNLATLITIGVPGLVFLGAWLYFIVERVGWRWLWIGWGVIGLAAVALLLLANMPGYIQNRMQEVDQLRRFTTITRLQRGTGKVRGLIWQGAVELITPHPPIEFPDGSTDTFNVLRPLVGYGPESMYVAYNSFYPAELGHYESRTASPDRSHNETLDSLVITGVLGLAVYLFTFGSFFYWGFRWLGLLKTRRQLWLYLGLQIAFVLAFFIIAWILEGAYLFAVAVPLGILVGMMIYLTVEAFLTFLGQRKDVEVHRPHPHAVLLIGVLSAVIAHFVEINFGIAIAATRTTFWALAGILVVLGLRWLPAQNPVFAQLSEEEEEDEPATPQRRRRRRRARATALVQPWVAAVIALGLVAAFLLGTLAFDFINNPERLSSAGEIFVNSLTLRYHPEKTKSYGALMIFMFTWVIFGVVGLSEYDREGLFETSRDTRWVIAIVLYAVISLMGLLLFGSFIANHHASLTRTDIDRTSMETLTRDIVRVADVLATVLRKYYLLIFAILGLTAWALTREEGQPRTWADPISTGALVVLLALSIPIIHYGSYNLIRADIIYKQGNVFANNRDLNQKQIGIAHYKEALEHAPREDYYNLFLGKAYLELAQRLPAETPAAQREAVMLETEQVLTHARELNPLNTDHSANLARFYKSWASRIGMDLRAEGLTDKEKTDLQWQRNELLQKSLENYRIALTLSPHNPIIWNELAQLYALDLQDEVKFRETISKSLEVDDEFEQTWMLLGDMNSSQGDVDGAIAAYEQALEITNNCNVRRVLGTLQVQKGYWVDAIESLETSIERCENYRERWDLYRILAVAYANHGQSAEALQAARQALALAPEDQKATVQTLLDQLKGQAP